MKSSIRTRVLAIVLVPIVALVAIGAAASVYLINEGNKISDWAEKQLSQPGINAFIDLIANERQLSLLVVSGDQTSKPALLQVRAGTDQALTALLSMKDQFVGLQRDAAVERSYKVFNETFARFPEVRGQVDAGRASPMDVYEFYNGVIDLMVITARQLPKGAPSADLALGETTVMDLVLYADSLAGTHSLALAAMQTAGGLNPKLYQAFTTDVGSHHELLEHLVHELNPAGKRMYEELAASKPWKDLRAVETALIAAGPATQGSAPTQLPVSPQEWGAAQQQVNKAMSDLWKSQYTATEQAAVVYGDDQAEEALLGGVAVGGVTLLALAVSLILAQRLVSRLRRLRKETLEQTEKQVPFILRRLKDGESVDVNVELRPLRYGRDEVGEVADAFNRAQKSAVSAAVAEAETREGANAVFLNIAHRSQVVVHRQLEVLDKAEYKQEDPEQLELLFQLDHLATRERRNAENLIILGGEMPGRQWRNPVPLLEVVRSSVAETEHYARVRTSRIPEVLLVGNVVADVIHLLAELVDNATSFSPPDSRVEIFGNQVGKGVVLEISDQGLGLTPEEFDSINAQLASPPEFGMMSLSEETRLGLFVVGRLAVRTGLRVRLVESEYGGVRAIVLIPSGLITQPPADGGHEPDAVPAVTGVPQPRSDRLERIDRRERAARAWQEDQESSLPTQAMHSMDHPPVPPRPRVQMDSLATTDDGNGTGHGAGNGAGNGNGHWLEADSASQSVPSPPPPQSTTSTTSMSSPTSTTPTAPPAPTTPTSSMSPTTSTNPGGWSPTADRPPLPTRRRQRSLAPQLAEEAPKIPAVPTNSNVDEELSPERSRDFMSAIQQGTVRGRSTPAPGMPGSEDTNHDFAPGESHEGDGRSWA